MGHMMIWISINQAHKQTQITFFFFLTVNAKAETHLSCHIHGAYPCGARESLTKGIRVGNLGNRVIYFI